MEHSGKPDPSRGVFETVLVLDGRPIALEAHLARLRSSLSALYGLELPAEAVSALSERAAGLGLGRVRLTAAPKAGPGASDTALDWRLDAGELNPGTHFPRNPVALRPYAIAGGLGPHKWADRAALPDSAPGEAPLLIDGREVLEAAWANVFAVRNGAVFTPPLDGRILPGVTRATAIELARAAGAEVVERPIPLGELRQADEVLLTNSIRGVERVRSVDGTLLPGEAPFTDQLVDSLQSSWALAAAR